MSEEVPMDIMESIISAAEKSATLDIDHNVLNGTQSLNISDTVMHTNSETNNPTVQQETSVTKENNSDLSKSFKVSQNIVSSDDVNNSGSLALSLEFTANAVESQKGTEPNKEQLPGTDKTEKVTKDEIADSNSAIMNCASDSQNSIDASASDMEIVDNCYCGKKRNLNSVELQCSSCQKWFHDACINTGLGKCLPFMTYYTFTCRQCSPTNMETYFKKQPNFSQMSATAIANLTQQSIMDGEMRTMFSKDKEVIPFIEMNWESLTSMPRRIKQSWHATVHKVVLKDNDLFVCCDDAANSGQIMFGLANQDLTKISPCHEAIIRGVQKQTQEIAQTVSAFSSSRGRSAKRKFIGDGQTAGGGKRIKSDLVMPKLPPNGYPLEHPFNKDGYRYILAEPDPHAPFRQEFDESQDWAGKPIPGWLYRKLTPSNVLIALHDRAPQLKISEDRLSVTGEKGYSMTRATHGFSKGTWYFELNIDEMVDNAATRLGWGQALGNLQAPLGYDKFSYSWRSRKGTKFHESRGYHYADEGYGQGDVIGCLIHLPPLSDGLDLPPIYKDKPLVKFKSYLYYEEKDELQDELKKLKPLPGSKIVFYKNGKSPGVAYENIYAGAYFPSASMYKNSMVTFNFGPDFKYPPTDYKFRGVYEEGLDSVIAQTMTDLLFFTENKGKLRLDL